MKLVYNPGNTPVSYGPGLFVDPESWAYADDENTRLDGEINDGRLVELDVPDELPVSVDPRALEALTAAVNDQQEHKQETADPNVKAGENGAKEQVRNTSSKNTPRPDSKSKNKEA